ncbi:helix-turn-helix transcriptional regulator [Bacillus sp. FSL M7-0791]|uniref:helix-turn-helix domain-containing protein n=1 Tax=Bacillus sp. FSL M7-0791 TaxID=2921535 RepID=UPI00315AE476
MAISYKPLWHLLVEKGMNKEDLKRRANITSNIIARMGKNSYINLESIEKICLALDCKVDDVVSIYKEDENETE